MVCLFVRLYYVSIQECHVVFWPCFVVVSCFVCFNKDVLVLEFLLGLSRAFFVGCLDGGWS